VIDKEAKGDSAKHVFISGQTTHITIEEEHPGGEEMNSDSPMEDDDFEMDVHPLPSAKHGDDAFSDYCDFFMWFFQRLLSRTVLPSSVDLLSTMFWSFSWQTVKTVENCKLNGIGE